MILIRKSLFARIFASVSAAVVLVVVVMALLVAFSMRDGFAQYLLKGELARFDDLTDALAELPPKDFEVLSTDQGKWHRFLRAHLVPRGAGLGPPAGPPPGGPGGGSVRLEDRFMLLDAHGVRLVGAAERSALFESRPVCIDGDCRGAGLLGYLGLNAPVIAGNANDAFFLRGQYRSLGLSTLIAIAISAAVAYFIARQLLGPIRRLEAGAKTMAAGNFAARIRQDRDDELGQLIGHYNTLAATLEQSEQAEREWISNTTHELQTPLAVLRAQIEALQDGLRQADEKTLTQMHAAMMRLSRLVQDLKTLSYAREAELAITRVEQDLSQIARKAADTARERLLEKGIVLDLNLPDQMPVLCDGEQIGQVVDNLLQNAIRYTDVPGRVVMKIEKNPGFADLTVDDTPPAVSEQDLSKLFNRFFRVEVSRSRVYGGSGLGLSVCKAIVEAHGGTITASRSDLGGLRIVVRLPIGVQ